MRTPSLGIRELIAATCRRCGRLFPGSVYRRHRRNARDRAAYVDQRCTMCKWGHAAKRGNELDEPA